MDLRARVSLLGGLAGGAVASIFGGWSVTLTVLVGCMAVDYLMGLLVAGIFHASPKSSGGGLESRAGWRGLAKKCGTLLLVVVAHCADVLLGTVYIRDAVAIGFCVNEMLSILENAGRMGLPVPKTLKKAVDALKEQEEA